MRRLMILVVGALCAAAAAAGTAGAQVAIGPPLNVAPTTAEGCEFGILAPLRNTAIPVPPNCTLFSLVQVPRGSWRLTSVNIRTGPRTGPMRVQIVQALRSQAQAPGTPNASGAICCTSPAQSQVFTLPPNSVSTVPVNLPVRNTVQLVDGEPIEVVDYLGLTLLDLNSSLPLAQGQGQFASLFYPALQQGGQQLLGPSFQGRPLISGVVCPVGAGAQEFTSHQAGGCPPTGPGGPPAGPGGSPGSSGSATATLPRSLRQVGVRGAGPRVQIPLACSAGTGRCAGRVLARTLVRLPRGARNARPVIIRPRPFRIAAGRRGNATLVLPLTARRELAARGALALRVVMRPAGGRPVARRVVLRSLPPRVRAARSGAVRTLLSMPPEAAPRPAVVQLRLGRAVVGSTRVRARPGRVLPAAVRLTTAGRQRLARSGRLRLLVRAVYRDSSGDPVVRTRPQVVLAPR